MTISNLERVLDQLRRFGVGFYDGVLHEQAREAREVMELAQTYTPVDTGALRASAHVTAELRELHLASAQVSFGGGSVDYAIEVHEDLTVFHPVGQAKYLQRAVDEIAPGMSLRIGEGAIAAAKNRSGAR